MQALANAELNVMEQLWDADGPLTARALRERLYPRATRAQHGTVQKLLSRLEDKGYVQRDRGQTQHLFAATVSREAYAGAQLESLTHKLTGGSLAPLLTHLIDAEKIDADELERLRRVLDEGSAQ